MHVRNLVDIPDNAPGPWAMPALADNDEFWEEITGAVPPAPPPPTYYPPTPYKSSLTYPVSNARGSADEDDSGM